MEHRVRNAARAIARSGPVLRTGALVALALWASAVLVGCHKPTKPKPARYRLFVGYSAPKGDILVFDTETDSLVDSIAAGWGFINDVPDAPYFAPRYAGDACFHVLETTTLAEVGRGCGWNDAFVAASENRLVAFAPAVGMYGNKVIITEMTGKPLEYDTLFTRQEIDSAHFSSVEFWQIDARAGLVYGLVTYPIEGGGSGRDLIAYDYRQHLRRIWRVRPDGPDSWASWIRTFHLHPDGRRIYFATYTKNGSEILCYDLQREEVVFRGPARSGFEWVRVTPDGGEVWVSEPGDPWDDFGPRYHKIAVLDADNGSLKAEIPTDTLALRPEFPWTAVPQQIRFVPGSSKAYLATYDEQGGVEPRLAVLDTKGHRIEKILSNKFGDLRSLVVAPIQ